MAITLKPIERPSFDGDDERPHVPAATYAQRCEDAYRRAEREWLVVYGDREHWGNLSYLVGFDPRFEEALLLLGPNDRRVLVVGNEGRIYADISQLSVDVVLAQSLSLMGQPRDEAPSLENVLREVGMRKGDAVGLVGWKYLESFESPEPSRPAFVPAFLVDVIRRATDREPEDATALLMHPVAGLRCAITSDQIASWEYAAVLAAQSVFNVIDATEPGATEYQAVESMRYQGNPLSAHVMYASGGGALNGLRSPSSRKIEKGDAVTTAIGFWGGLTCRAGRVIEQDQDGFLDHVAFPYFNAIRTWYSTVDVGVEGGSVWEAVDRSLRDVAFRPLVNPGHLIGHEEWTHTPFRRDSPDVLRSGMAMQCDIIPYPLGPGEAVNAEDTVVLASERLRHELRTSYPSLWERIVKRRTFMRDSLGIEISEAVLPLSPTCGYLPPLWLSPLMCCVYE